MPDLETGAFCREIEAHLCRRNAGHLVRIVGPAFEMVAGWAKQGIPLKVALRGIDTCVERRNAKGPSRRPLRVEFCEADVLDAFDQWRRAVGIGSAGGGGTASAGREGDDGEADPGARRNKPSHSLRAHLDRVVTRLTDRLAAAAPAGGAGVAPALSALPEALEAAVTTVLDELASAREPSRSLRGEARAAFVARLSEVDDRLMEAARDATPRDRLSAIEREAAGELAGFRDRMSPDDYARAVAAASTKLLREWWRLPDVEYGG